MPKVSVIVPIYGVEKYIEQCARSLFEQTLDDMEYIFIDDCSLDDSLKVLEKTLDQYPQRKSQVIIHKMETNCGQARVRKWGMQYATGEYVIHCDSDDWIERSAYELLYKKAQDSNSDIVFFDFYKSDGNNHTLYKRLEKECYDKVELLELLLCGHVTGSVCGALFKRDLYLRNFDFPKADMGEDWSMVIQMVLNCETLISYIPIPLYYYRINNNSISKSSSEYSIMKRLFDNISNSTQAYSAIEEYGLGTILSKSIDCSKMMIKMRLLDLSGKPDFYKQWDTIFPELNKRVLLNNKITLKQKVVFFLCCFHVYHILKNFR